MTESKEEINSLLIKVKEESGKVGLKRNIQKTKIMTSGPNISWQVEGEKVGTVAYFIFLGSKITVDSDYSHEIKRHLLLGRKAMTNLVSVSVSVLVAQSCPTLCDPMDWGPPCSSHHGIFQATILELVAIPSLGDLPNLGIEPRPPALQADSLLSESLGKTKPLDSVLKAETLLCQQRSI